MVELCSLPDNIIKLIFSNYLYKDCMKIFKYTQVILEL